MPICNCPDDGAVCYEESCLACQLLGGEDHCIHCPCDDCPRNWTVDQIEAEYGHALPTPARKFHDLASSDSGCDLTARKWLSRLPDQIGPYHIDPDIVRGLLAEIDEMRSRSRCGCCGQHVGNCVCFAGMMGGKSYNCTPESHRKNPQCCAGDDL